MKRLTSKEVLDLIYALDVWVGNLPIRLLKYIGFKNIEKYLDNVDKFLEKIVLLSADFLINLASFMGINITRQNIGVMLILPGFIISVTIEYLMIKPLVWLINFVADKLGYIEKGDKMLTQSECDQDREKKQKIYRRFYEKFSAEA